MTAALSVSAIKAGRARQLNPHDGKPREGTMLRQFYDDLRRGEVVAFGKDYGNVSRTLRDFYGMDIVCVKSERGGNLGSRLVGEWDGPYYIPIERIVTSLLETA